MIHHSRRAMMYNRVPYVPLTAFLGLDLVCVDCRSFIDSHAAVLGGSPSDDWSGTVEDLVEALDDPSVSYGVKLQLQGIIQYGADRKKELAAFVQTGMEHISDAEQAYLRNMDLEDDQEIQQWMQRFQILSRGAPAMANAGASVALANYSLQSRQWL